MKLNLAAGAGRWSASHWKTATFGWLAFVTAAVVIGGTVGTKQLDQDTLGSGESGRMDRILEASFDTPAEETVLVQSRTLTTKSPAFQKALGDVVSRVSALPDVRDVRSPRELSIGAFGAASADREIMETVGKDLERAGLLSVPVTPASVGERPPPRPRGAHLPAAGAHRLGGCLAHLLALPEDGDREDDEADPGQQQRDPDHDAEDREHLGHVAEVERCGQA